MHQRRLWLAASIIAAIVLVGFVISVPRAQEVAAPAHENAVAESAPVVTFTETSRRGVRTISGSVLTPDACTTVAVQSALQGEATSTQKIIISFDIPASTGICLKVPTQVPFSTSLTAPEEMPLEIHINGVLATSTAS